MNLHRSAKFKFVLLVLGLFTATFCIIHNIARYAKRPHSAISQTSKYPAKIEKKFGDFFGQQINKSKHNILVSERGFWSGTDAMYYHEKNHAPKLSRRLVSFFKAQPNGTTILDFGGGSGLQVANLLAHGQFASCYDGNPDAQTISSGVCATLDLTKPINIAVHDWVLCLSVGRQIPPHFVPQFVENLHKSNAKGIILYWGDGKPKLVPAQRLKSIKDNDQVLQTFKDLGYSYELDVANTNYLRGKKQGKEGYSLQVLRKLPTPPNNGVNSNGPIVAAIVSCGDEKLEEALTNIKSAILFSQHTSLQVHIFTDDATWDRLEKQIQYLQNEATAAGFNFSYKMHLVGFPPEIPGTETSWREVFKPCSLQRLFLPSALPEVDALIYLDADTLALSNLTHLWDRFKLMNSSQFTALAEVNVGSAPSFSARHNIPHYGKNGVNCGLALMNLTRMREFGFEEKIKEIRISTEMIRLNSTGDQYLQNVLYSLQPELVAVLPCEFNLRRLQCHCSEMEQCGCKSAIDEGVALIHGTKDGFTDKKRQPLFRHIFEHFKTFDITNQKLGQLLLKLSKEFELEEPKERCFFNSSSGFYKKMSAYIQRL